MAIKLKILSYQIGIGKGSKLPSQVADDINHVIVDLNILGQPEIIVDKNEREIWIWYKE